MIDEALGILPSNQTSNAKASTSEPSSTSTSQPGSVLKLNKQQGNKNFVNTNQHVNNAALSLQFFAPPWSLFILKANSSCSTKQSSANLLSFFHQTLACLTKM